MKIAKVESFRLYPVAIKEAWVDDEYVWPSHPPSFLIRVTAESGETGVGEITSQQWYLGETADQIAELIRLYDQALQGAEAGNIAMCHFLMEEAFGGGMPGSRGGPLGRRHGHPRPRRQGPGRAGLRADGRRLPHRVRAPHQPLPQDARGHGRGLPRVHRPAASRASRSRSATCCCPRAGTGTTCSPSSPSSRPPSRSHRPTSISTRTPTRAGTAPTGP